MSSDNNADKNSSAQNEYPVKIDEQALAARIDPLSYNVLRKAATEQAFTGEYTDIETVGVYNAKPAPPNYLEVRQSFTQVVAGHLFMRHLQMMQCA